MLKGGSAKIRSTEPSSTSAEQLQAIAVVEPVELEGAESGESDSGGQQGQLSVASSDHRHAPIRAGLQSSSMGDVGLGTPAGRRGVDRRSTVGVAVAVWPSPLPAASIGVPPSSLVEAELGELLVQGVAVDAQPGGGLDLDAVARLEDLLDQLALDPADDPVVQVVRRRAGGADALADQLGAERGRSVAPPRGRIGRGTLWPRSCGGRCSTGSSAPVAQDHRPLDVVLQLADVPRPVVLAQAAASPRGGPSASRGGSARRTG